MSMRRTCRFWHKWFGILAGGWLFLLAVTGIAITWYDELDIVLNPDLRTATTSGPPAPLDEVRANAAIALPGFELGNLIVAPSEGRSHWLLGRQILADGNARPMQIFADPASAEILGWRESGMVSLNRHHIPDLLYGLHVDFLLGQFGVWLVGFVGLAWLLDHFLSLPLAFPRRSRWSDAFAMKGRVGSMRRLFDWHRAKGMWLWIASGTLALTGVTLTFPEASRDLVRLLSPVNGRLHETMPEHEPTSTGIGLDRAIASVATDGKSVHSLRPMPEHGLIAVRTYDPRDVDSQGRLWTYVDSHDGSIIGRRHDVGTSAGDAFFAWQYALHSGQAFSLAGRVVVTVAGVVTLLLCYSGWRLWWRRRRKSVA